MGPGGTEGTDPKAPGAPGGTGAGAAVAPGVRLGAVSFVWRPWLAGVTLLLAAATFLVFCLSIGVGDFPIALSRVVATLLGRGEQVDEFVIMDLRMPRA
ncbi:iron ABC transporter permease, partial [Streptomyces olivaceus]